MSKKERARLEAEQAEHQRMEQEREKLRRIEEEKMRKVREKEEAERKQVMEIVANKMRKVQFVDSYKYFALIKEEVKHLHAQQKKDREVREGLIRLWCVLLCTERRYIDYSIWVF